MPYIQIRTNKEITKEQEIAIKERLGEAITIVGKSESWLMIEFVPNCNLYFKGNSEEPIAFVDVKLYGKSDSTSYNNLTGEICASIQNNLQIPSNNIYISYAEYINWGWNGRNF